VNRKKVKVMFIKKAWGCENVLKKQRQKKKKKNFFE
jgi:hypothetical protein